MNKLDKTFRVFPFINCPLCVKKLGLPSFVKCPSHSTCQVKPVSVVFSSFLSVIFKYRALCVTSLANSGGRPAATRIGSELPIITIETIVTTDVPEL